MMEGMFGGVIVIRHRPCFRPTMAEMLYDMADHLLKSKGIVVATRTPPPGAEARLALALKFRRMPSHIFLKAVVEDWDYQRIYQEVH